MSKYLIKRLLLIAVTWFGIALICFVVMMAAPGDPAALKAKSLASGRAMAVSEYVLRKNREMFNLDRPKVLNSSPETRTSSVKKTLAALRAKEKLERDDARATLVWIGTAGLDLMIAALPEAVARCEAARGERETLLVRLEKADAMELGVRLRALHEALPGLAPRLEETDADAPAAGLEARRRAWLAQKKTLLAQAEEEARTLLEVLAAIGGKAGPQLAPDAPLKEGAEAWAAWWEQKRLTLGPDQVASAVTAWLDHGKIPAGETDPPGAELEALERVGTLAAPALMAAFQGAREGSDAERMAAYGLARVCRKPWDLYTTATERRAWEVEWEQAKAGIEGDATEHGLSPEQLRRRLDALGPQDAFVAAREAGELDLHRYRWKDWWYRAEEHYVDFGAGRQLVRAFTQTQFGRWMGRFIRLDFGESYKQKRPVSDIILERFPRTLTLEAISIFLAYLVAIPLGVFSATHHGRLGDRISTVVLFVLYSIPTFWAGAMCIWLLTPWPERPFPAYHFSSLDADKYTTWGKLLDIAWHLVLPVLILTYGQLAYISRQMRTGMLEAIRQDYVRTARAKGLAEGVVVYKHALRNALIPILTLLGSSLPVLYAGSVIIETVFTIDGLGKLYFDAIQDRDYPVIMANLVISALLTLVGYLLSDVAYAVVDPRIEFR